jgi:hypothetical protein
LIGRRNVPRTLHFATAAAGDFMRRRSTAKRPSGKDLRGAGIFPGVLAIENNEGYICGGLPHGQSPDKYLTSGLG